MVGWCFNEADTNQQILVCFEIHFAVVGRKKTTRFTTRNEQQNISYEMVAKDKTRRVGCTNIPSVYWNIVFASYNLPVPVSIILMFFEEWRERIDD